MKRSMVAAASLAACVALGLSACSGSGFDGDSASSSADASAPLSVLIAASGDAEANAVRDAVAEWSKTSGREARVELASDLVQQLAQGFAGGKAPDVFYTSSDQFVGYAQAGNLLPYGDKLDNKDDFYPVLRETFTYDDTLYCAPKDFSTLALLINTDMWAAAGLTEADYPTTWEELKDVAAKLTTGDHVGLTFGPEYQRLGVFFAQAGGGLIADGKANVDTAENAKGLDFVKELMESGSVKLSSQLGAGWGGEAFGKQQAAMVIEGNWVTGALANDFPDVHYAVVELPAGPGGKGTLEYTNCWGISADTPAADDAVSLVEYLTSTDAQMGFAKAFGVMPSVQSAASQWEAEFPNMVAFLKGADYAQYLPTQVGAMDVISSLNATIEQMPAIDTAATLRQAQADLAAVLDNTGSK